MVEEGMDPDKDLGKPLIFSQVPFMFICRQGAIDEDLLNRLTLSVEKQRDEGVLRDLAEKYLGAKNLGF